MTYSNEDVAVIGISCRLPGADSPSQFWENLVASKDIQKDLSERFNVNSFYRPPERPGRGFTNTRHAYTLDEERLLQFDPAFFAISPHEARAMDPQQRILLEVAYEAFENAGKTVEKIAGTRTGVFAGISGFDYATSLLSDTDNMPNHTSTGTSNAIAANRISYVWDLRGPSLTIDTACSSTMVALHHAVASLKARESSMALVCGSNIILNPDMFIHMTQLGFLSTDGRCRSFDASGNGYARGEGVAAILIKPLEHALADNDPVHAILKGTRVNQDGKTASITQPSQAAQVENMTALYNSLDLSSADIQYVEAHGTGTKAGDHTELASLIEVFDNHPQRPSDLVVGSAKSNIGHLEACAGLAGVIKTIKCLEHGCIPPQMHFSTPNALLLSTGLRIPTQPLTWPHTSNGVRRAAVNSFGYGGTNGHVVLEEPERRTTRGDCHTLRPLLFKVSAASEFSLRAQALSFSAYVQQHTPHLHSLAYTTLARRSTLAKSAFVIAASHAELVTALEDELSVQSVPLDKSRDLLFIFTGQGAQWPRMGQCLLHLSPTFRRTVQECDRVLQSLPDRPSWCAFDELEKGDVDSHIYDTAYSQPLCCILQIALVDLWRTIAVRPSAIVGHSSGEIAAAFAAGFLSLRDAVICAFYRGQLCSTLQRRGAMCAVSASYKTCSDLIVPYDGKIEIAAINASTSITLSGDDASISDICAKLKKNALNVRKLKVETAYHSAHMDSIADLYENRLTALGVRPQASAQEGPRMYSSVLGGRICAQQCNASYWRKNLRQTVRFSQALSSAIKDEKAGRILEIGPHPALRAPALETIGCANEPGVIYIPTCQRGHDDWKTYLMAASSLVASGYPLCAETINLGEDVDPNCPAEAGTVITDFPSYCWDHSQKFNWETQKISQHRFRDFPRHDLLGVRDGCYNDCYGCWTNTWSLDEIEWFSELEDKFRLSAGPAILLAMAVEAARQIINKADDVGTTIELRDVRFADAALAIPVERPSTKFTTQLNLSSDESDSWSYMMSIQLRVPEAQTNWHTVCSCRLGLIRDSLASLRDFEDALARTSFTISTSESTQSSSSPSAFHADPDPVAASDIKAFLDNRVAGLYQDKETTSMTLYEPATRVDDRMRPWTLAKLLQVAEKLDPRTRLPGRYQLCALTKATFKADSDVSLNDDEVSASFRTLQHPTTITDLTIRDAQSRSISLEGMHFTMTEFQTPSIPDQSFFFDARWRQDVTFLPTPDLFSISEFISLIKHKWGMVNTVLVALSNEITRLLIEDLGIDSDAPICESLNILGPQQKWHPKSARVLDSLEDIPMLDLAFVDSSSLEITQHKVKPDGFVLIPFSDHAQSVDTAESMLCQWGTIHEMNGSKWLVYKAKTTFSTSYATCEVKVFNFSECFTESLSIHSTKPQLDVIQCRTSLGLALPTLDGYREFDAIVFDNDIETILLSLGGQVLLPWLQSFLDGICVLLWVCSSGSRHPFGGAAGAFLKALSNEHPAVRFATISVDDEDNHGKSLSSILELYAAVKSGSKETSFRLCGNQAKILRYVPDNNLSASMALIPPISTRVPLNIHDYHVALLGCNEVRIIANKIPRYWPVSPGMTRVRIKASLIDHTDKQAFQGPLSPQTELGWFFWGSITYPSRLKCDEETSVIGWCHGAHRAYVDVPKVHLMEVSNRDDPHRLLSLYATTATAYALVHECARIRSGDTVSVEGTEPLVQIVTGECRRSGALLSDKAEEPPDFVIDCYGSGALLVNKQRLSHRHLAHASQRVLEHFGQNSGYVPTYSLKTCTIQQVLSTKERNSWKPLSTILMHTESSPRMVPVILQPAPRRELFALHGAYIIVGGLGGLGKRLCEWMAENGARNVYVLSRQGNHAKGFSELSQRLGFYECTLHGINGDARDTHFVNGALSHIRSKRPIKACFNLAMVLENAPFSRMRPEQWDTAISTKVQISRNLHDATINDNLDFFIMLSSVSAIIGNRAQTNYATGNGFQNSLAEYRRANGLPSASVALGPVLDAGALANDPELMQTLRKSGLEPLSTEDFLKSVEAALEVCHDETHSGIIVTGLHTFQTCNGNILSEPWQDQLFWVKTPEFNNILIHRVGEAAGSPKQTLRESVSHVKGPDRLNCLWAAFKSTLSGILGNDPSNIDMRMPLSSYGIDSLSAMACRYWIFRELDIDVSLVDILGSKTIEHLLNRILETLDKQAQSVSSNHGLPTPARNVKPTVRSLAHSQERLWFLQSVLDDRTSLNLLLVWHIRGEIDTSRLASAWSCLIQRHEILHSRIEETASGLQQIPTPEAVFDLTEVVVEIHSFDAEVARITAAARSHEFNIANGNLIRGWLLRSNSHARFFLASHHLAWDRQSTPTIFKEIRAIYRALGAALDAGHGLPPPSHQFIDYAMWQRSLIRSVEFSEPHIAFWINELRNAPEAVSLLPNSKATRRPEVKQFNRGLCCKSIPSLLARRMTEFCKQHGATLFMLMAAVVDTLIFRLTGDRDIVLGVPDSDRGHPDFDELIGFAVNMLPIRVKVEDGRANFNSFFDAFRSACLAAYEHRIVPFDVILQNVHVSHSTSHTPVFQVTVNFQSQGFFPAQDFGDFQVYRYDHYNSRPQSDFSLDIEEMDDGSLACEFSYDTAVYKESNLDMFADCYITLISSIIGSSGEDIIQDLNIVPNSHAALMKSTLEPDIDVASYTAFSKVSFSELLSQRVRVNPEKLALVSMNEKLTWGELNMAVSQVSHSLNAIDIPAAARVGILCSSGCSMVAAIYGILQSGYSYVPFDTELPNDRIASMVDDTNLQAVIVEDHNLVVKITACGLPIHSVFVLKDVLGSPKKAMQHEFHSQSDREACCIFTSGSTGRPKGVALSLTQIYSAVKCYSDAVQICAEDRLLLSAAPIFDASLLAIFGILLTGGTMCIASNEARLSPEIMLQFIQDSSATSCVLTPTQLKVLLAAEMPWTSSPWARLTSLVMCGESPSNWLLSSLFQALPWSASVYNGYGPTETCIGVSYKKLTSRDLYVRHVPLRGPTSNAQFALRDSVGQKIPVGVPGELFITGPTVCSGYIKRSDLTEQAFSGCTKAIESHCTSGLMKTYRTGDLFVLEPDGNLIALGRVEGDRQIKVRGMRVDLDEIESVLWKATKTPDIVELCAVQGVAVTHAAESGQDGIIVAYIVAGRRYLDKPTRLFYARRIKVLISSQLPLFMQPSQYRLISSVPTTTNGKTNYRALTSADPSSYALISESDLVYHDHGLTPTELDLINVWGDVVPNATHLSSSSDFFEEGGHSLLLFRMQKAIKEQFRVTIPIASMFAASTVRKMAEKIDQVLAQTPVISITSFSLNGSKTQPMNYEEDAIDWDYETAFSEADAAEKNAVASLKRSDGAVLLVGGEQMLGVHMLAKLCQRDQRSKVYYIINQREHGDDVVSTLMCNMRHWRVSVPPIEKVDVRIEVMQADFQDEQLGLTSEQISRLKAEVDTIFNLSADVSLLQPYSKLKAANVGIVKFLLRLALGPDSRKKSMHHLSTWAVPHLQTWTGTRFAASRKLVKNEVEMAHFLPDKSDELGYLKARWACEKLLCNAALNGLDVTIYRTCMCAGSSISGVPLDADNVNGRILAGCLETGMVPDFTSEQDGGMSWISVDFLADSMYMLAMARESGSAAPTTKARFWHIVSDQHITYRALADVLSDGAEAPLRLVSPEEWCAALRESSDPAMTMQAEVLEAWWASNWVPFGLEGEETLKTLRERFGLTPPIVDRRFLLELVLGRRA